MFSSIKKIYKQINTNDSQISTQYTDKLINDINEKWSKSHHQSVLNSCKASDVESHLPQLLSLLNKKYKEITIFKSMLNNLPEMNLKINEVLSSISNMESLFEEIESAMYLLEDLCDQMDIQENKLNHRLKLAGYREEKKMELENIQAEMEESYQIKLAQAKKKMNAKDRERCLRLEQAFLRQLDECEDISHKRILDDPYKIFSDPQNSYSPNSKIKIVDVITTQRTKTNKPTMYQENQTKLQDDSIMAEIQMNLEESQLPKSHLEVENNQKAAEDVNLNRDHLQLEGLVKNIASDLENMQNLQMEPDLPGDIDDDSENVTKFVEAEDLQIKVSSIPEENKSLNNAKLQLEGFLLKSGATVMLNSPEGNYETSDAISSLAPTPGTLNSFKSLEDELKEISAVESYCSSASNQVMVDSNEYHKIDKEEISKLSPSSCEEFTPISSPSDDLVIL